MFDVFTRNNFKIIEVEEKLMLPYPISVFIDTNIYLAQKFDLKEGSSLKLLSRFVSDGRVKLVSNDVTMREVSKHFKECVHSAYSKIKTAREEASKQISLSIFENTPFIENLILPDFNEIEVLTQVKIDNFFTNELKIEVMNNSDVNIIGILEDYFECKPPFENCKNKKHEFPDAVVASKLKIMFSESKPVWIISSDVGFIDAFNGVIGFNCFNSLKELFDLINQQDRMYNEIVVYLHNPETINEISIMIKQKIEDQEIQINGLDCDRKGYCEGFEYDEVFIEHVSEVSARFNTVDSIERDNVYVTVTCGVHIQALCTYEDYDNSIWDSEEKEYIVLETTQIRETHYVEFESEITVSVEYDEGNYDFYLNDVNYTLVMDQYSREKRQKVED